MKPYKIEFYVYASDEIEVKNLEKSMFNFVNNHYKNGVLVTAKKMTDALHQFGSSLFVTNFLKKK